NKWARPFCWSPSSFEQKRYEMAGQQRRRSETRRHGARRGQSEAQGRSPVAIMVPCARARRQPQRCMAIHAPLAEIEVPSAGIEMLAELYRTTVRQRTAEHAVPRPPGFRRVLAQPL